MKSEFEFLKEKDIEADMKEMETYMERLQTSEFNYNFGRAVKYAIVLIILIAVIGIGMAGVLWR